MIVHPGTIITTFVDLLRAQPSLVSDEMLGDESRIVGYYDSVPNEEDLEKFILGRTPPFILIAYMGFVPGRRATYEIAKHGVKLLWRGRETVSPTSANLNILYLIENATGSDDQPLRHTHLHDDLLPIGIDMQSKRLPKRSDGVTDLWTLEIFLTENGG